MNIKLLTRRTGGFTVIEMILLIVLFGVVGAIAIPRFGGEDFSNRISLKGTAKRVASDMRRTRALAVAESSNYSIRFNFANKTYGIYNSSGTLVDQLMTVPSRITLSGQNIFTFTPLGSCSLGAGTGIITLRSGGYEYQVKVIGQIGLPITKAINP